MLDKFPYDIQTHIYTFMKFDNEHNGLILQKSLLNGTESLPFKNWIIEDRNKIIKIQKFYRHNLPRLPEETGFNMNYYITYNKKLLVRHYISKYPMTYLLPYPESVINSLNNIGQSAKAKRLMNWVVNNTPTTINKRTRRHVRDFLMLNEITKQDIIYTGW